MCRHSVPEQIRNQTLTKGNPLTSLTPGIKADLTYLNRIVNRIYFPLCSTAVILTAALNKAKPGSHTLYTSVQEDYLIPEGLLNYHRL